METLTIAYQTIWFDFTLADGSYTPLELRRAGLRVQQGPERTYTLTWPGGVTQPPRPEVTPARRARATGHIQHQTVEGSHA